MRFQIRLAFRVVDVIQDCGDSTSSFVSLKHSPESEFAFHTPCMSIEQGSLCLPFGLIESIVDIQSFVMAILHNKVGDSSSVVLLARIDYE